MKKEIMEKWVEALRSGEYHQRYECLISYNKYTKQYYHCALGVLCDLAIKDGVPLKISDKYRIHYQISDTEYYSTLPLIVMRWAGIETAYGVIENYGSVVSMNDYEKKTFPQIADIIEKYYKEL